MNIPLFRTIQRLQEVKTHSELQDLGIFSLKEVSTVREMNSQGDMLLTGYNIIGDLYLYELKRVLRLKLYMFKNTEELEIHHVTIMD